MTDEELDRARAIEAHRQVDPKFCFDYLTQESQKARILAAKLAREGWMPVDPKLIRAREIAAEIFKYAEDYSSGRHDDSPFIKGILVALNEK